MCLWARLILAHPYYLGRVWPKRKYEILLGQDRPNPFWVEIGPTLLELSPAQLVGRPSPAHLVLYIIYYNVFYIIYIHRYI
jgi:hypothetical protein